MISSTNIPTFILLRRLPFFHRENYPRKNKYVVILQDKHLIEEWHLACLASEFYFVKLFFWSIWFGEQLILSMFSSSFWHLDIKVAYFVELLQPRVCRLGIVFTGLLSTRNMLKRCILHPTFDANDSLQLVPNFWMSAYPLFFYTCMFQKFKASSPFGIKYKFHLEVI